MKVLRALDRWWFAPGNPVALGLLRIFLSWMALVDLTINLFDYSAWYTEGGFAPVQLVQKFLHWDSRLVWAGTPLEFRIPLPGEIPRLAPLNYTSDDRLIAIVYGLTMIAAVLFLVGKWCRLTGPILALGLISIHTRDPLMIHSGDTLMRLCVIYLALSPAGAALSLDRLSALAKGAPRELPKVGLTAQRLIAFQVMVVYFMTVLLKWQGFTWQNGTATWIPSQLEEFYKLPMPAFFDRQPFLMITTWGTLIIELALVFLVFSKKTRKWALLSGVFLHAYIDWRFTIPMYSWVIVSTYVSYYSGEEVQQWLQKVGHRLGRRLNWQMRVNAGPSVLESLNSFGLIRFLPKSPVPAAGPESASASNG